VIGDRYGPPAPPKSPIRRRPAAREGLRVMRNKPYAGGFITQNYGSPTLGRNALQIEINRGLYIDEQRFEKTENFLPLQTALAGTIKTLLETLVEFANPQKQAAE
jgi:N-formylglutamate amidohydrolase